LTAAVIRKVQACWYLLRCATGPKMEKTRRRRTTAKTVSVCGAYLE
jgi:hypothetical protein